MTRDTGGSATQLFEVLFYDGHAEPPAYYLLEGVEGESPEQALQANLTELTQRVRSHLHLCAEVPDLRIHQSLYVMRPDGLVSAGRITEAGC